MTCAETIVWLGESECHEWERVGGKAARLSRLAARYRVPSGFCIPASAYEPACRNSPEGGPLPAPLTSQVSAAYRLLEQRTGMPEPAVAVRSSAVDEDGDEASFAGQHETYLNVRGLDALAAAIARCWESARSERALAYRRERGLSEVEVRLAVLVQALVVADVSMVAFSVNPVTARSDEVLINATWGLGESLVSGGVTPDAYRMSKSDGAILSREPAEKRRMTVALPGGTREVDVPRLLQTTPCLEDPAVREVARLATDLERDEGAPVDIECAYCAGNLYLLQCRPVTAMGEGQ